MVKMTDSRLFCGDICSHIGNTPLVRLRRMGADTPNVSILFKAEWLNPSGSVKDRSAYNMIRDAEKRGKLALGEILLDSTSGNNGTSLAMIGAALGYRVRICMPSSVTAERKQFLTAYGAELVLTDPAHGSDGAIWKARELAASEPGSYCYLDQYSNPANWLAHYEGTGEEIWSQTGRQITHFVAALGSSGTFTGITRKLRELNPAIRCISLSPDRGDHGLRGMKHMGTAMKPAIYDPELADEDIEIGTEESYEMVRRIAREEGLLVGISSGAAMVGCLRVAKQISGPATIVTVFPDSANPYLSHDMWKAPQ